MFSIAKYAIPAVAALSCHAQQEGKAEESLVHDCLSYQLQYG